METLLRSIYAGWKYPHVYTPSISTGENLSIEAHGALYVPTYEYNYKVIKRCDTILQEYYITDRSNCENTSMNGTKGGKTRESSRRAWKDRALDGLSMIYASATHLWLATERIHKLQTLKPGHEDPGESELPSKWWCKCLLAQRPITLILMMINSCSYSTNDLVFD